MFSSRYQPGCSVSKVVPVSSGLDDHQRSGPFAGTQGGLLSSRYVWYCSGPRLEVVDARTGRKTASWTFGAASNYQETFITCVCELAGSSGRSPMLVVGLECATMDGMICIFDVCSSRVLRTIRTDERVTSLHVVDSGCESGLPGMLRPFDGTLAVGLATGKILLVDLCRQSCDEILNSGTVNTECIRDELNSCGLIPVSLDDVHDLEGHKEFASRTGDHLCVQLNENCIVKNHFVLKGPNNVARLNVNLVEVKISALHYCPQMGSLLVGFNFGALQIWNLLTLRLEYTSPVSEDYLPVTHFAFQEPCDDPRAYCYVWAVYNHSEQGEEGFPIAVMYAVCYDTKEWLEGYGYLYQKLVSCSVRFQTDLIPLSQPAISKATGGSCLSLKVLTKGSSNRNAAGQEIQEDGLTLCNVLWCVWDSRGVVCDYYMCIFDLNQWYKEQMPSIPRIEDTDSYLSYVMLSRLDNFPVDHNRPLLDIRVDVDTLTQFTGAQHLEEHYYPSSLSYVFTALSVKNIICVKNTGVQQHLLVQMESAGPLCILRPTELFKQCLSAGLTPLFMDITQNNSLETEREFLLAVALENQLTSWLCRCATEWANGSYSSCGCTLDMFLNWAWKRANVLKNNATTICIPLFDYSGTNLDSNAHRLLNYCTCQLRQLTSIYNSILGNCSNFLTNYDFSEVQHQHQALNSVSVYFEVLQWLLNVGLLPESSANGGLNDGKISAPYPVDSLTQYFHERRKVLWKTSGQNGHNRCCDLLFIDNLIEEECGGQTLKKQWESAGGSGLYPPPSMQSLLQAYLLEGVDIVYKHCIFIYVFLDLAMILDQHRYKSVITHLIKFPAVFQISSSIIKITQAFWQMDHGDFATAMDQLLDPLVKPEDLRPWQHRTALRSFLVQGQNQHALLYLQVRQPPLVDTTDVCITVNLLLSNGLFQEAMDFQRKQRSDLNREQVLKCFFKACDEMNALRLVIRFSFDADEEVALFKYLKQNPGNKVHQNLRVMYYFLRARYVEAVSANDQINKNKEFGQGLIGQMTSNVRDVVMNKFTSNLPNVMKVLLDYCRKQDRPIVLDRAKQVVPMSVLFHDGVGEARYKSSLIGEAISKTKELWTRTDSPNVSKTQNTPFLCTPKQTPYRKRSFDHTIYPEVIYPNENKFDEGPSPTKKLKLTPRQTIRLTANKTLDGSLGSGRSMNDSYVDVSSFLSTPLIKRKSQKAVDHSTDFGFGTPQSILKVNRLLRKSPSPVLNEQPMDVDEEEALEEEEEVVKEVEIPVVSESPKRKSILSISPRKSLPRTPRPLVRFEDRKFSSGSSAGEAADREITAPVCVQRETSPKASYNSDADTVSKNSSKSTEDTFYSPQTSFVDSDLTKTSHSVLKDTSDVSFLDDANEQTIPTESPKGRKDNENYTSRILGTPKSRQSYRASSRSVTPENLLQPRQLSGELSEKSSYTRTAITEIVKSGTDLVEEKLFVEETVNVVTTKRDVELLNVSKRDETKTLNRHSRLVDESDYEQHSVLNSDSEVNESYVMNYYENLNESAINDIIGVSKVENNDEEKQSVSGNDVYLFVPKSEETKTSSGHRSVDNGDFEQHSVINSESAVDESFMNYFEKSHDEKNDENFLGVFDNYDVASVKSKDMEEGLPVVDLSDHEDQEEPKYENMKGIDNASVNDTLELDYEYEKEPVSDENESKLEVEGDTDVGIPIEKAVSTEHNDSSSSSDNVDIDNDSEESDEYEKEIVSDENESKSEVEDTDVRIPVEKSVSTEHSESSLSSDNAETEKDSEETDEESETSEKKLGKVNLSDTVITINSSVSDESDQYHVKDEGENVEKGVNMFEDVFYIANDNVADREASEINPVNNDKDVNIEEDLRAIDEIELPGVEEVLEIEELPPGDFDVNISAAESEIGDVMDEEILATGDLNELDRGANTENVIEIEQVVEDIIKTYRTVSVTVNEGIDQLEITVEPVEDSPEDAKMRNSAVVVASNSSSSKQLTEENKTTIVEQDEVDPKEVETHNSKYLTVENKSRITVEPDEHILENIETNNSAVVETTNSKQLTVENKTKTTVEQDEVGPEGIGTNISKLLAVENKTEIAIEPDEHILEDIETNNSAVVETSNSKQLAVENETKTTVEQDEVGPEDIGTNNSKLLAVENKTEIAIEPDEHIPEDIETNNSVIVETVNSKQLTVENKTTVEQDEVGLEDVETNNSKLLAVENKTEITIEPDEHIPEDIETNNCAVAETSNSKQLTVENKTKTTVELDKVSPEDSVVETSSSVPKQLTENKTEIPAEPNKLGPENVETNSAVVETSNSAHPKQLTVENKSETEISDTVNSESVVKRLRSRSISTPASTNKHPRKTKSVSALSLSRLNRNSKESKVDVLERMNLNDFKNNPSYDSNVDSLETLALNKRCSAEENAIPVLVPIVERSRKTRSVLALPVSKREKSGHKLRTRSVSNSELTLGHSQKTRSLSNAEPENKITLPRSTSETNLPKPDSGSSARKRASSLSALAGSSARRKSLRSSTLTTLHEEPDVVEEYSKIRRLTRQQKSVMQNVLKMDNAVASTSKAVDIVESSSESEVEENRGPDLEDLDPVTLLDKGDFEGQPDAEELKVLEQSICSSESSGISAKRRSTRAGSRASQGGSPPMSQELLTTPRKRPAKNSHSQISSKSGSVKTRRMSADSYILDENRKREEATANRRKSFVEADKAISSTKGKQRKRTSSQRSELSSVEPESSKNQASVVLQKLSSDEIEKLAHRRSASQSSETSSLKSEPAVVLRKLTKTEIEKFTRHRSVSPTPAGEPKRARKSTLPVPGGLSKINEEPESGTKDSAREKIETIKRFLGDVAAVGTVREEPGSAEPVASTSLSGYGPKHTATRRRKIFTLKRLNKPQ